MSDAHTYDAQRDRLETYFDRTAAKAWEALTSDAPVSRIRATVRAGREEMRSTLLSWLPPDLNGLRILDAGCGTGALAMELARRGAAVVAVDVAPSLLAIAVERTPRPLRERITWHSGDMLDPGLGEFDAVVAMDSLIHYRASDIAGAVATLSERAKSSILMTFAPQTPLLRTMHVAGKLFPRKDRSPAIQPVRERRLRRLIENRDLATLRSHRVATGFYISQALEIVVGPDLRNPPAILTPALSRSGGTGR